MYAQRRAQVAREHWLSSPAALAARIRSRTAFRDLPSPAAEALIKRQFGSVLRATSAVPAISRVAPGRVVGYVNDYEAIVHTSRGPRHVYSNAPFASGGGGPARGLDLRLRSRSTAFVPANSAGRDSIGRRLGQGGRLGAAGVTVTMEAGDVTGHKLDDSVFYGNVSRDVDASVAPTPGGLELFAMLRSSLSTDELSYRVDVPRGAVLRPLGAGAQVTRSGHVLARIAAPSATDSQGQAVPTSMTVTPDHLILHVAHRMHAFAYPILVDPQISEEEGAPNWTFKQGVAKAWELEKESTGPFIGLAPGGIEGPNIAGYEAGDSAQWIWPAPAGQEITNFVYFDTEGFSPNRNPNPYPFEGYVYSGCTGNATQAEKGEGAFAAWEKSAEAGCPAKREQMVVWFRRFSAFKSPENSGHLVVYALFATEASITPEDGYGEDNPGEPLRQRVNCGYPVNCGSGNLFTTQTDISLPGHGAGIALTRTYNSQAAAKQSSAGAFGYGWSGSYSAHLVASKTCEGIVCTPTATIHQDNGSTVVFEQGPLGEWATRGPFVQATLKEGKGSFIYTLPDQSTLTFSAAGQLSAEADRNGVKTSLAYNSKGQLTTVEDMAGRKIALGYNSDGTVKEATGPLGSVLYEYTSGNLTQVTDLDKHVWKFGYDGSHQMTSEIDPLGHEVKTEFGTAHRVISQVDPLKRKRTWKYTTKAAGTETTVTDPKGSVAVEQFNQAGQPTGITHASGTSVAATTTYSYDDGQNLISVTDPDKHTTTYGYDGAGNVIAEEDPLGHKRAWKYDSNRDELSEKDAMGHVTEMTYTTHGDLETLSRTLTETGSKQVTSFAYGEASDPGEVTSITDPDKRTTTLTYNKYGDLASTTDPAGHKTTFEYDSASRRTATVSPLGNVEGGEPSKYTTRYTYNNLNRLLSTEDPRGHTNSFEYDATGNLTHATDASKNTTVYVYDADHELEKTERPGGTALANTFDSDGDLLTQTDGNKNTTTYTYNALDQPESVTDPDKHTTTYEFDGAGNLKSKTDPLSRVTTYGYDADYRLTGLGYSDSKTPAVSFEYNNDDQRTAMKDGTGASSYEYDSLGRLLSVVNGAKKQVGYSYDLANQLIGTTYPSGSKVTRTYDEAGRISSIEDWKGDKTSFEYDANSNLTAEKLPAATGVVDTFKYDTDNQPETVTDKQGATTLASFSYGHDSDERLASTSTTGLSEPAQTYQYTALSQLSQSGETKAPVKYAYDSGDNLTARSGSSTLAYDPADELCWQKAEVVSKASCESPPGGATKYTYDANGSRTGEGATTYSYDQAARLIGYNSKATYAYDGDGLRASKTLSSKTEQYTWDSSSSTPLLLEDATNRYIYGPDGAPLEQISISGEAVTYLHHDQLGSTRLLTNSTGEQVGSYNYDPYGAPTHSGSASTPLQYAGQYTDAESGLVYMRGRYYDPASGQFLTRDPLVALTGTPYGYAGDNPLNNTDPSGLLQILGVEIPTPEQVATRTTAFFDGLTQPFAGGTAAIRNDLGIHGINTCSSEYEIAHRIGGNTLVVASIVGSDGEGDPPATDDPEVGTSFPEGRSQTMHIFRNSDGHLTEDTPEIRELLAKIADTPGNLRLTKPYGVDVYAQRQPDGTEVWVEVRGGIIQNGGVNQVPRYGP